MFGKHSWAPLENISSVLDGSVWIRGRLGRRLINHARSHLVMHHGDLGPVAPMETFYTQHEKGFSLSVGLKLVGFFWGGGGQEKRGQGSHYLILPAKNRLRNEIKFESRDTAWQNRPLLCEPGFYPISSRTRARSAKLKVQYDTKGRASPSLA